MTRQTSNPLTTAFAEYGDAQGTVSPPIDMHLVMKTGNVPLGVNPGALKGSLVDVARWLPFAAEAYNISSSIRDFVLAPVTIFHTDIPNANACAFPLGEMSKWNASAGDLAYRTWRKKPTFSEHANSDHTRAKGVIFDASMRPAPEYIGGLYRVVLLNGWDRDRDPALAQRVSTGRAGASMGSWVEDYQCSACNASMRAGECAHMHPKLGPKMREERGKLIYRIARGVTGFECSEVRVPAYRAAMAEAIG